MLFTHIIIVDALCNSADVDGDIKPKKPIANNVELNPTIKR